MEVRGSNIEEASLAVRPALSRAVRWQVLAVIEALEYCLEDLSEPNVHALRVAARHLSPALEVLNELDRKKRTTRKAQRLLRALMDITGPLRDQQLRCLYFRSRRSHSALRAALLRDAERELRAEVATALDRLDRLDMAPLRSLVVVPLSELNAQAVKLALNKTLKHCARRLRTRLGELEAEVPRTIHRARVALKRYRYTIKAFHKYLPVGRTAGLACLERHQKSLGRWHDERVMADWLMEVSRRIQPSVRRSCAVQATVWTRRCQREEAQLVSALRRMVL